MKAKKFAVVGLIVVVVLSSFSIASASERGEALKKAGQELTNKAKEVQAVIKDFVGSPFEKQCKKAIEDLKKNPNSSKQQMQMCSLLMAWTDELSGSFKKAKQADLTARRDRVVKGFQTISELKAAEAKKYQNRANTAKGHWKTRYEQLSAACLNFSKAYLLRAEQYEKLPIIEQIIEVQACLEYLVCVKEVIGGLKECIEAITADKETLQQLLITHEGINSIQKSILTFSEVVINGVIEAGQDLTAKPGTSEKSKEQPKKKPKKKPETAWKRR